MKYRKALLDNEVTKIIIKTAEGITERYTIEMEAIGIDKDHIHLLCSAHPKVAPGRIVQIFKSITAREIFLRKPTVKKSFGEESSGQMATMLRQLANVPIGTQWRSMSKHKVNPKQNSGSSNYFKFDTLQQAAG